MGVLSLSQKLVKRLNKFTPVARDAELGTRLGELETYGRLSHSYANAHADKTYAAADLPITQIVHITLTLADQAANLILPAIYKVYVIYNNSGQTITVKITGQTGVTIPTGNRRYVIYNGTDIVPLITYLQNAVIAEPELIHSYASHDYAGAAADWTLSAAEAKKRYLIATNANGAVNAIIPAGKNFVEYVIVNTSGQALTLKCPSGTGIVVASTKTAIVYFDGTNMKRLTADA